MKALLICSSAFLVLAPLHCGAASTAGADRGSLYNYLNTQEFAEGAKKFYLETIASNDKRKNMIAEAQEDCGGRYEGTSVTLTELSHAIETDKSPIVGNDKDYTLPYSAKPPRIGLSSKTSHAACMVGTINRYSMLYC